MLSGCVDACRRLEFLFANIYMTSLSLLFAMGFPLLYPLLTTLKLSACPNHHKGTVVQVQWWVTIINTFVSWKKWDIGPKARNFTTNSVLIHTSITQRILLCQNEWISCKTARCKCTMTGMRVADMFKMFCLNWYHYYYYYYYCCYYYHYY
jgi:hypothetical protein